MVMGSLDSECSLVNNLARNASSRREHASLGGQLAVIVPVRALLSDLILMLARTVSIGIRYLPESASVALGEYCLN